MNDRVSALYKQVMGQAAAAQQLPVEYQKLKAEAEELKQYAEFYLYTQLTLQFIATAAMVGMFVIALRQSNRKG